MEEVSSERQCIDEVESAYVEPEALWDNVFLSNINLSPQHSSVSYSTYPTLLVKLPTYTTHLCWDHGQTEYHTCLLECRWSNQQNPQVLYPKLD